MDQNELKDPSFWNILSIKSTYYILGGVSFVAALSWSNSIKDFLEEAFPRPESKVHANFIYSIIITVILVLLIYLMPDTEVEMPKRTRKKIKEEKERQALRDRIDVLEYLLLSNQWASKQSAPQTNQYKN